MTKPAKRPMIQWENQYPYVIIGVGMYYTGLAFKIRWAHSVSRDHSWLTVETFVKDQKWHEFDAGSYINPSTGPGPVTPLGVLHYPDTDLARALVAERRMC